MVYNSILGFERTKKVSRYVLAFVLAVVVNVSLKYIYPDDSGNIELLCCLLGIGVVFVCSWKEKIFAFIPVCLGISCIDQTVAAIVGVIFDFNPLNMLGHEKLLYRFLVLLPLWVVLFVLTIYLSLIKPIKRIPIRMTKKSYVLCVSAIFCLTMLLSIASFVAFTEETDITLRMLNGVKIFAIASTIIILLFVYLIHNFIQMQMMRNEMLAVYEKKNELQNKYYQELHEKNEKLSKFRHDYHHHMNYLLEQLQHSNYEAMKDYIQTLDFIGERVMQKKFYYSGNHVIDAIISGIIDKKENEDIHFSYQGKVGEQLGIRDIDLSTILCNALENAVEACKECTEAKEIGMEISQYKEHMMIQIQNTYSGKRKKKGNIFLTQKREQQYHGYGIQNMMGVIEQYDGNLELEAREGIFFTIIQLNEKHMT